MGQDQGKTREKPGYALGGQGPKLCMCTQSMGLTPSEACSLSSPLFLMTRREGDQERTLLLVSGKAAFPWLSLLCSASSGFCGMAEARETLQACPSTCQCPACTLSRVVLMGAPGLCAALRQVAAHLTLRCLSGSGMDGKWQPWQPRTFFSARWDIFLLH